MSDFSLMDAIECGIVKLPRVPVADNIPEAEVPVFRELWSHIAPRMPEKGRGKGGVLDPLFIPTELQTALEALSGHCEKTFNGWAATPGVARLSTTTCARSRPPRSSSFASSCRRAGEVS